MNAITPQQLVGLMDDSLDTESFHEIYRNLTRQPKKVPAFGLMFDNPKYMTLEARPLRKSIKQKSEMLRQAQHDNKRLFCHSEELLQRRILGYAKLSLEE